MDTAVTATTGTAERNAAILMLGELPLSSRPSLSRQLTNIFVAPKFVKVPARLA